MNFTAPTSNPAPMGASAPAPMGAPAPAPMGVPAPAPAAQTNNSMTVNLSKGQKVSLSKMAPSLSNLMIGLGWDVQKYDGAQDFDLDSSIFLCAPGNKVTKASNFVFYNNLTAPGVQHMGDNRTGAGDGDDEVIKVNLNAVEADVDKLAITVTIDQADTRHQNFGMVENAYIRVVDESTGNELLRYDLGEDYSIETAVVIAEIYRNNGEWKFNAIGSGFAGGLAALCNNYGLQT